MTNSFRYKAFISYSHRDEKWASWLHRQLEAFRLPATPQSGRKYAKQPLRPVFRDRDELSSSTNLTDALLVALKESECLIVVCSRHSASSQWVNAEIEKFIELGRGGRVFALIVDDTNEPVFPRALVAHGNEPLAADVHRDGKRNAFLKTVAGLLSLRFDELRRRQEQNRHRKLLAITLASLTGIVITSVLAIYAVLARDQAEHARVAAENSRETAQQVTDFLVGILEKADPVNTGKISYYCRRSE